MTLLQSWVATPLAAALGWTLLHSLWEGAIVAAALALVLVPLRSPRARYAAACLALLAMLAAFCVTLVLVTPQLTQARRVIRITVLPAANVPTPAGDPAASNPTLAAAVPWLAPFWVAGVCVFYLGFLASWISVSRLRRRGVCCPPDPWQQQLNRLCVQLRLSRPVRLLESCLVEAPMVIGHLRPVILIPLGLLAGLPAGQVEAILLHELAHIRRYDFLVNILQRSVEGLLFYHPAVWWISRVIRAERENCCDDVVVAASGNAREYAVALAALEQNRWRDPALAATGGSLMKRIRRLLYPESPNGAWTPVLSALILLATAAVALTAWQAAPPQAHPAPSPYELWLNQDVVYIITESERAEFKKLTTDRERESFIEQFWLRRDPTPDTVENEFKEEHYRRIAYANERFASGIPGWNTDRGRIYIIYGPPDEIESHPGAQNGSVPFEEWLYHHIEGVGDNVVFRFTDTLLNGEYRLTLDPTHPHRSNAAVPQRIRVGGNVQEQNLINRVDPVYPPLAQQARIQGVVRFEVIIGKDGRVLLTRLISGHPLLVAAAEEALRQWIYKPTLLNGQPVEVATVAEVPFQLP